MRSLWTPHGHLHRTVSTLRRRPCERRLHRKEDIQYGGSHGSGRVPDTRHGVSYRAAAAEANHPASGKETKTQRCRGWPGITYPRKNAGARGVHYDAGGAASSQPGRGAAESEHALRRATGGGGQPSFAGNAQLCCRRRSREGDSGEGEKQAEHSARSASGDDETEDDAASVVSWVSVEEMAVEESCLERGRCDGKDNQEDCLAALKGSQGGWRPSLKAKTEQVTSVATRSEWWNMKGDDDDVRHGEVRQSAVGKTLSSPAEQQTSKKAPGEGTPKRTEPSSPYRRQQPSEPAPQHGGASQRRGQEESQHGAVGMKPNREGKMAAADELKGQTGAASSDELEPGELVIDERAATPEPLNRTPQEAFSMPAGVGRGRNSRSRDPEAAHGSILSLSLRPSGPGAHTETDEKRTRCSTKKARRDVAGHRRDSTPGSEHEEVKSKQRSSQQPATGDVDTDSDFY
ncbi:hypothetical protein HPB51_025893 [Rhipicephalus microplus]|uniref:Uncharacterized protein n=1 Tax=Rhipicephalus microplus TaxID=6941 RepID=A0A9J6F8X8_RHIMP|nr:hypothetical protein HPB51_025893 [Rhipicephalus microplus]